MTQQQVLIDSVPKFASHKRDVTSKQKLSNAKILAILEKLNTASPKHVSIDFSVSLSHVYKLRDDYVEKNGVLYRRVDNGNE